VTWGLRALGHGADRANYRVTEGWMVTWRRIGAYSLA